MALINFRTYVHKKTGTTTKVKEGYTQVEIPRELIENSSDRELVEAGVCDYDAFREAIEKYAPKQKKFTEEEIYDFYWKTEPMNIHCIKISNVYNFLKEHNLLSPSE